MNDIISREAVADAINGIECTRHTTWYEFYQKVMTAVEKLPTIHPELGTNLAEVGTDCISRQAAIDALRKMQTYKMFSGDDMLLIDQAGAMTELMLLPPAEPKRGKWIYQNGMIKCDQCLRAIRRIDHDGLLNFCPNCGVDMRGEQDG